MQYTVKKSINNNILRVVDPTGCERIVHERGERCHPLCGWLRAGSGVLLQLPF